jgi:diguanylate cyclase (GGDEF)-like protein/PAS domain S-box-containing protein
MPATIIHALFNQQGDLVSSNHSQLECNCCIPITSWQFNRLQSNDIFTSSGFHALLVAEQDIDVSTVVDGQLWLGSIALLTPLPLSVNEGLILLNLHLVVQPTLPERSHISSETLQQHLRFLEQELNQIVDMAPAVTYKMSLNQQEPIQFISHSIGRLLGYEYDDVLNQPSWWLSHIHPDDHIKYETRLNKLASGHNNDILECEYRFRHSNGRYIWLADGARVITHPLYDNQKYVIGSVMDINETVQLNNRIEMLTAVTPGVLYLFQPTRAGKYCFPYASPQLEKYFGISPDMVKHDATPIFEVIHPDDVNRVYKSIEQAEIDKSEWQCEFRVKLNGEVNWFYGRSIPHLQHDGLFIWAGLLIDVSDQKKLEFRLHKESTTDPLTGCYNRRYFMDVLQQSINDISKKSDEYLSVIAIDFDHFKAINDEYGHEAGDEVLRQVTKQIRRHIRKSDCLARMGGEEFNILLPQVGYHEAFNIAEKLRSAVENLSIVIGKLKLSMTMTLGVSSTEHGFLSKKELLRRSDRALYKGKAAGRNCVM